MADLTTYAILAASAFFVALSLGLLYRYRQISQRMSLSSDLGRVLSDALETRLKKQDERILDMMGRVEVIQSRFTQGRGKEADAFPDVLGLVPMASQEGRGGRIPQSAAKSRESHQVTSQPSLAPSATEGLFLQAVESRLGRQDAQIMEVVGRLEAIQSLLAMERGGLRVATETRAPVRAMSQPGEMSGKRLLEMLGEKPRTSVEVRQRFGVSREHAARLLKGMFDKGLVSRNDSGKPFVYELTEIGRQALSEA
jgi:CRP-like cAMP-binding protein